MHKIHRFGFPGPKLGIIINFSGTFFFERRIFTEILNIMKRNDLICILCVAATAVILTLIPGFGTAFNSLTSGHPFLMSFIKFAILSTFGEMIGLRIKKGVYYEKGFGLLPRMAIWGILGMCINGAFIVFKSGTVSLYGVLGLKQAGEWFAAGAPLTWGKVLVAFTVSVLCNTFFAPVFMTFHKISDTHIKNTGGSLKSYFFTPMPIGKIMVNLDWNTQWNFVFKKTIPLFWYPAHTLTFLLPANIQILFAAFLGVALGVILAVANNRK